MTNSSSQNEMRNGTSQNLCEVYMSEETYHKTRTSVDRATTMLPDAYRCSTFANVEGERLWSKSWVCVGYTSQLSKPGDYIAVTVADQPILVTCSAVGKLHAFYNVCRHRGSTLVENNGNQKVIRCPYHAWGYSLTGELLGCPFFEGIETNAVDEAAFDMSKIKNFNKRDYGLLPVHVETWGCFVFINLDEFPRPLAEQLGDLPQRFERFPLEDLQLYNSKRFDINANWKLVAENFMEYYHLPWVHPELTAVSGMGEHKRFQGSGMYTGMTTSPLSYDPTNPLSAEVPPMLGLDETEQQSAYWILIFPNIALFLLPNHLFTLLYRADGSGHTIESADMLIPSAAFDDSNSLQKYAAIFDFWDFVNQQDIEAVERVQKGIQSKAYPGGRMCYHFEEPIHRFQNMVIDFMVGDVKIPPGDND